MENTQKILEIQQCLTQELVCLLLIYFAVLYFAF